MNLLRRSRLRTESGFTVIELGVAGLISSLVLSAVVLIVGSVGRGADDARRRAELQIQAREAVTQLAAELRSAVPPQPGSTAIESLSADSLVFYSDRYEFPGPERMVYERTSCDAGYCSLRVRRYAADPSSEPNWTHQTTPFADAVLLGRVAADDSLFSGRVWVGGERTSVPSCGGSVRCDFTIVAVDLRAAPPGVDTIAGPFGLFLEVNLRNV
ncbi:MAG: hypothetical protein FJW79_10755 [Actinobacteria bacterium]|nr:hypothetical protein [Actinomycetota bacterium]